MLVIMALLGTIVEVARGKVCRIYGRRTLRTATDSLLTEYSRPLYEKYHLFFIENGGEPFRESIAGYAAKSMGGDAISAACLDFYDGVLNDVAIGNERYAGDEGAAALQEQITEYMKRSLASDAIEKILGQTKQLDGLSKTAEEIDRKVEEEREAAEGAQGVLELMRLIDGVDCSGSRIKGQGVFVKMFFSGNKEAARFGIAEPMVWNAIKGNVVEIQEYFGRIQKSETAGQQFFELIKKAETTAVSALSIAEKAGTKLKDCNVGGDVCSMLRSNLHILQETKKYSGQTLTDESISELKELWKGYNTSGIVFDYTGIDQKGGAKNPMDSFADAVSGGLSKLVLKKDFKISRKTVKTPDRYRGLYAGEPDGTGKKTSGTGNWPKEFAQDEKVELKNGVKGISNNASEDIMLYEYMKKHFSTAVNSVGTEDKRLDYEWEYILCGGKSDQDNLDEVISRLVLMRSVIDTAAILSSTQKRNTAYTAALAVVGFTGLDLLVRFTQTLFIILWGTAEALVDVAALLQGKKVPLVKTADAVAVEFSELYQISNRFIVKKAEGLPQTSKSLFGYPEHLMLLMAGTKREDRRYRMMDLMEWNIRDNVTKKFNFGICVDSFEVTGNFTFATKFFRLPSIQEMADRQLYHFQQSIKIGAGYVRRD